MNYDNDNNDYDNALDELEDELDELESTDSYTYPPDSPDSQKHSGQCHLCTLERSVENCSNCHLKADYGHHGQVSLESLQDNTNLEPSTEPPDTYYDDAPENEATYTLHQLGQVIKLFLSIAPPDYKILYMIYRQQHDGEPTNYSKIARELGTTTSPIYSSVKKMLVQCPALSALGIVTKQAGNKAKKRIRTV